MRDVELFLDAAAITGVVNVLVCCILVAKEVAGHALDVIETEAITLALVQEPPRGANEHRIDVFGDGLPRTSERMDSLAEAIDGGGDVRIRIEFRMGRLADAVELGIRVAFLGAEIGSAAARERRGNA